MIRLPRNRKAQALAYLEAHPEARRACFADVKADPAHVVLTVAVREPWGAIEVLVRRERFDAFALMELSLRYPATKSFRTGALTAMTPTTRVQREVRMA